MNSVTGVPPHPASPGSAAPRGALAWAGRQIVLGILATVLIGGLATTQSARAAPAQASLPRIVILATGGTIAGVSKDPRTRYSSGDVAIAGLLQAVPELSSLATIRSEQVANIGSQDMSEEVWAQLARRIAALKDDRGVDGIVVTHGTDTMEETAFYLDLLFPSGTPIVLTGAMRPSDATSADGPQNIVDAVKLASLSTARDRGVLVAINGQIHAARHVRKAHTENLDAFSSGLAGLEGELVNGLPTFARPPHRAALNGASLAPPSRLAKVGILYAAAAMDPAQVRFLGENRYEGLVLAGIGNGNANKATLAALKGFAQTGAVVRATRVAGGRVSRNIEVNDDESGFVAANDLSPQKARILLMLLLPSVTDRSVLQRAFHCDTPLLTSSCGQ